MPVRFGARTPWGSIPACLAAQPRVLCGRRSGLRPEAGRNACPTVEVERQGQRQSAWRGAGALVHIAVALGASRWSSMTFPMRSSAFALRSSASGNADERNGNALERNAFALERIFVALERNGNVNERKSASGTRGRHFQAGKRGGIGRR
jgi:hypothetical protein